MPNDLKLSIALGNYGHTKLLKNGSVPIMGVTPDFVEVEPIIAAFRRMVRETAYDVCELAPTTYMIARSLGAPFKALPIYLMRRFHHGGFVYRNDAGITQPKDLEGKKVGVRAYSVTTGVWTRGILQNEYGVDPSKVTWVVDDEEHVTTMKLPPNVIKAEQGKSLASMMADGELQAGFTGPAGIGRAGPPTSGWENKGGVSEDSYPEMIPDSAGEEARWFKRTGIYPIHGLVVVKDEILERNPWLAQAMLDAFMAAKAPYIKKLEAGEGDAADDIRYRSLMPVVGDPLPYGMAANSASIEAMIDYAYQQRLIADRPDAKTLFVDI
jgi:4,5-dihydroxyphthalate decarboxylase